MGKGKGKGSGIADLASDFAALREHAGITILRKNEGLRILGTKEQLENTRLTVQALVTRASQTSEFMKLLPHQVRLLKEDVVQDLSQSSGAEISRRAKGDGVDISGSPEAKERAKERLQDLMDREGCMETVPVPEAAIGFFITRQGARIKEVEEESQATLSLKREEKVMMIVGSKEAVAEGKVQMEKALQEFAKVQANTKKEEVTITKEQVRVIIGVGGKTSKDLKAKSGVEVLSVEEDGPAPKVVLKGTDAQVKSAVKLIKKLLEDHSRRAEERKTSKDAPEGEPQMNGHSDTKKGGKDGKAK